ncbi:Rab11 [Hexamita inflata]|uniref:Rab11 n=1 Tax=Hexamita inflata TaxID=28002 RepID=A0AA86Q4M5_9EUKA|nr:Rab11 [Hexamita inflata]
MSHLGSTTIIRNQNKLLQAEEESELAKRMLLSKFPDQSPDQSLHEMIKSGVLLAKLCNMLSSKQIIIQEKNHNMYHLENLAQVKRRLLEFGLKETQIFDPQDLLKPEPKYALHLVSLLIFAIEAKTHIFNLSAEDVEALECIDNNSTINLLIEAIEPFQDNDSLNPFTTQQNALLSADSTQFVATEPLQLIAQPVVTKPLPQYKSPDLIQTLPYVHPIRLPSPSVEIPTVRYKLVLIGDSSTGKSSICRRLMNQGIDKISATVNLEQHNLKFSAKTETGKLINVDLVIQDTAGMERFRSISQQYVRNADVILLVYSVNELQTISGAKQWFQFIKNNNEKAQVIAVGNKSEIETKISQKQVEEIGADKYMQCSALTGDGIAELLQLEWKDKEETDQVMEMSTQAKEKKGCCLQ